MKRKLTDSVIYKVFLPFMRIHNSVYVFMSGILISLSTNLLTSLCFEPIDGKGYWCIYITIISSAISSAMFIVVATKLTTIQDGIKDTLSIFKNDDIKAGDPLQTNRKKILLIELTENHAGKWIMMFLTLAVSTIASIVFTILKFVLYM